MTQSELQLLLDINNDIATIRDRDALFDAIAEKLRPIFHFDAMTIGVLNKGQNGLQIFYKNLPIKILENPLVQEVISFLRKPMMRIDGSPFEMLAQNPTAQLLDIPQISALYPNFLPFKLMKLVGAKEGLVAPLKFGNDVFGVFNLISLESGRFKSRDVALLEKIVAQVSIAVSNMLAFQEVAEKERETAMRLAISNALTTIKDREQMFQTVAEEINKLIDWQYFGIMVMRENGEKEEFASLEKKDGKIVPFAKHQEIDEDFEVETSRIGKFEILQREFSEPILSQGEAFEKWKEESPVPNLLQKHLGVRSLLSAPIQLGNGQKGIIFLAQKKDNAFSDYDLQLLASLAPQFSLALENLFAFEQIDNLRRELEKEKSYLLDEIKTGANFEEIIGISKSLQKVLKEVRQVAPTDSTVLILGETGTGKELIARAVHNLSGRKQKPLVKVNCAALPAQLIESELFGHEKGSFTGATEKRLGKFELADGGTIFLDEIGDLQLELQAKLLRVLQEREFERIGGKSALKADVRVIAATNRELQKEVLHGKFRADLFFRLSVFPITLPPLRERREDIPVLVMHFVQKYAKKMGKQIDGIKEKTMKQFLLYQWQGNIRELEHIIERAVILCEGKTLSADVLLPQLQQANGSESFERKTLEEMERDYILKIIAETKGKISGKGGAAEILGMKPTTLESRMKKLGIERRAIFG